MIANQEVALTSEVPGTTTDVVEKHMELLPVGPVTFLDTGGIDDQTNLAQGRLSRTNKAIESCDIAVLITDSNIWTQYEQSLIKSFDQHNKPFIIVVNKIDLGEPDLKFLRSLKNHTNNILFISATEKRKQNQYIESFKGILLKNLPSEHGSEKQLLGDLLPKYGVCVMIVPIDKEAPKGRIILPQVQAIRNTLDNEAISVVVKDTGYRQALDRLKEEPNLVICDSQVVDKMVAETPVSVPCTTFSILFARFKGDLNEEVRGLKALNYLKKDDKVLIAEACSHHPNEDDIGRVKIPKWLMSYLGFMPKITVSSGRDYPEDINKYKMIIHCGGCMLTRNEKQVRIEKAKIAGVAITNYGIIISHLHGVLKRVLSPFPTASEIYRNIME